MEQCDQADEPVDFGHGVDKAVLAEHTSVKRGGKAHSEDVGGKINIMTDDVW